MRVAITLDQAGQLHHLARQRRLLARGQSLDFGQPVRMAACSA